MLMQTRIAVSLLKLQRLKQRADKDGNEKLSKHCIGKIAEMEDILHYSCRKHHLSYKETMRTARKELEAHDTET